jgi:hypothetical protein
MTMKVSVFMIFSVLCLIPLIAMAQNEVLVRLDDIYPDELVLAGFTLKNDQEINIEAAGVNIDNRYGKLVLGKAWILNSETREVVWFLKPEDSRSRRINIQEVREKIKLAKGTYEVYFASYPLIDHDKYWHGARRERPHGFLSSFFEWIFDHDRWEDYDYDRHLYRDFNIVARGNGEPVSEDQILQKQKDMKDRYFIFLDGNSDDLYLTQGFEVTQPTKFSIDMTGEARDDGDYDYGWITDLNDFHQAWTFDYEKSEEAGGASKNVAIGDEIELPAGKYLTVYVTDDSHSPADWNSMPPDDPNFWGMGIRLVDPGMIAMVKKFDYSAFKDQNQILSLAPLRDNDFESKGFTLTRPLQIRIYAIGEGRRGDMYDYGWIINAKTNKRIWEMDYRETTHAGGRLKNRMINQVLKLDKGSYIAYFITDDSHSYRHWNSSPPFDPEHWGLTIYAADENYKPDYVKDYRQEADPSILAKIVGVRDDQYKSFEFTLGKDSEVRIYALGEGLHGDMYDYGWIEDVSSGKIVWEMRYRNTERAGGARKNRMTDETVLLEKGKYQVYYETDDSHAFREWNDAPPRDPINWGITVYLVK